MYANTITVAMAILSGAALALGAPLAANETEMAVSKVQSTGQFGEVCEGWPLIDSAGAGRGHYQCSTIPSGVQVRGVFSNGANTVYSDWFSDMAEHTSTSVSNGKEYTTSIEAKKDDNNDDDDISNGDCVATRHEYDVSWGRNKFSVSMKCTRIRAGVKARGVLDLAAQEDDHTSWVFGPIGAEINIESGKTTPSTLTDPKVRVEYALST